ncbi:methyltransferase family protein [Rhodoluna limnophila]|uniref:methyltransferase family protein n=1 Tax=Rhodoluna limnophila TaxID=232537 RepID=UPI001106C429|nr:isoprenylcysteine carboxylmethyltransferase family protein [Rhodoluna limnophila]
MSDKAKGNLLVIGQFGLLIGIVMMGIDEPVELWAYIGGVLFIAPGILILFFALRDLGASLTANPVPKEKGKLVTTGLYQTIRHPIYTGLLLASFGSVVQSMAFVKLVFWLLLVALITYKAIWEESLLEKKYQGYADYKKQTGRFLPKRKK